MPSNHLYPDPIALAPVFLSGEIDLDDTDAVPAIELAETILSMHPDDRLPTYIPRCHTYTRMASAKTSPFMFGRLPQLPQEPISDEMVMNLFNTELI
jgi:hypothetical protein